LREADSSRIGLSSRHLSFFEMFVYTFYGSDSELPIEESTENFCKLLFDVLGLEKEKILVTVLQECNIENQKINENETQKVYDAWTKFLPEKYIKKTKGRRNFFIAKIPDAAGGTGVEIFYKTISGQYVEIGSQLHYHFIYHGHNDLRITTNGNFGNGLGLERLIMVLENQSSVYNCSLVRPIKEVIINTLNDGTEEIYDENINIIADHIRALVLVFYEKSLHSVRLSTSQEKILDKLNKNMRSQVNYLGLSDDLYEKLVDKVISIYQDRFPTIIENKKDVLAFINKKS